MPPSPEEVARRLIRRPPDSGVRGGTPFLHQTAEGRAIQQQTRLESKLEYLAETNFCGDLKFTCTHRTFDGGAVADSGDGFKLGYRRREALKGVGKPVSEFRDDSSWIRPWHLDKAGNNRIRRFVSSSFLTSLAPLIAMWDTR